MTRKTCLGFIPLAVLALGFLVTTLITITAVTNNPVRNFAVTSWAKVKPKTWRDIGDPRAGRHEGKLEEQQASETKAEYEEKLAQLQAEMWSILTAGGTQEPLTTAQAEQLNKLQAEMQTLLTQGENKVSLSAEQTKQLEDLEAQIETKIPQTEKPAPPAITPQQTAPNPFETFGGRNPELISEQNTPWKTVTEPPHVTYQKTDDGFIKTETTITRRVNADGTLGDVVNADSVRTQTKVNTAVRAYQESLSSWRYVREDTAVTTNADTGDVIDAKVFTYDLTSEEANKLKNQPSGSANAPIRATIDDYKDVATAKATGEQIEKLIEQCGKYCDSSRDLETFALTLLQQADNSQNKNDYMEAKTSFDQRYSGLTPTSQKTQADVFSEDGNTTVSQQPASIWQRIKNFFLGSPQLPNQQQTTLVDEFGRALTGPGSNVDQNTTFTTVKVTYEKAFLPFTMRKVTVTTIRDSAGNLISTNTSTTFPLADSKKIGTTESSTVAETPGKSKITILPTVTKLTTQVNPSVPSQQTNLPSSQSQVALTVPYKGYINPENTPSDLQTIAYLTDLFNSVMNDQGIPDMNDYKAKAEFMAEVKKRLVATNNPQLIELANSKAFNDYFAGDRVVESELFGFYQEDINKKQLLNCNQWAIGVSLMFPDLHIVADQYPFQNGGVFDLPETVSNTPGCNTGMEGALSQCSGDLKFAISGDVAAYRFTDYGKINKGDSFAYGQHFGVILDKYYVNGKYYFMVTEANSPKGKLDGQPQTYLVSQDDFASRVNDLGKTYFLRLNKYDQTVTPPSIPTAGIIEEVNNYNSQQVVLEAPVQGGGSTVNINSPAQIVTNSTGQSFPYYSQFDYSDLSKYRIPGTESLSWANKGCGIMTGAMVTGMTPEEYWKGFSDAGYGFILPNNIKNENKIGTSTDDHKAFLESRGYRFIPIEEDNADDVKNQIKGYTADGIPVWVDGTIVEQTKDGPTPIGHIAMAIGVDENNEIILNDPAWSAERHISDRDINRYEDMILYAVIPPGQQ